MTLEKPITPDNPSLKDLLDQFKKEVFLGMNCHHIATIQTFNSDNQTVTATINYRRTRFNFNSQTNSYDPVSVSYPLVVDCPLIILGGGNANITFPISEGDECILLFNDRDLDNWFSGSNDSPVNTTRLHSFSDAVALVGLRSKARSLTGYDNSRARIYNGETSVGVSSDKVEIKNAATNLLDVINGLIDVVRDGFDINTPTSGNPLNPTAVAALNAYKSTVESLLE